MCSLFVEEMIDLVDVSAAPHVNEVEAQVSFVSQCIPSLRVPPESLVCLCLGGILL